MVLNRLPWRSGAAKMGHLVWHLTRLASSIQFIKPGGNAVARGVVANSGSTMRITIKKIQKK